MSLPETVIALDLEDIFLFFLDDGGVDTRCRRVMAITLSLLAFSAPKTSSLVVLVFLRVGGGSLLSRRRLFPTRCVSRGGVGGLILSTGVFLLILGGLVLLRISKVYIAGAKRWLEHRLYFYINGFLYSLFPGDQVMASGIQLGPNKKFQAL